MKVHMRLSFSQVALEPYMSVRTLQTCRCTDMKDFNMGLLKGLLGHHPTRNKLLLITSCIEQLVLVELVAQSGTLNKTTHSYTNCE